MTSPGHNELTHWVRVAHICVGNITIIRSDNGLFLVSTKPLSEPMLQYCWTLRNKFQWNIIWNSYIFIEENAFENVCEMAAILSWPQCVNPWVIKPWNVFEYHKFKIPSTSLKDQWVNYFQASLVLSMVSLQHTSIMYSYILCQP